MKHLFSPGLIVISLLCYTYTQAQQTTKESNTMQGAYSMLRQIENNGTNDSMMKNEQFKIYTDRYMMYASPRPEDSLAIYGIGTYKVQNGKVMEYVFYSSIAGAHNDTFELDIRKTPDGYSQIIVFPGDQGRNIVLTEDYKNVSKTVTSPLDGAWKQTKRMYITKDGRTMTEAPITQFKVFQSGHFIWANTMTDSATQKPISAFGYGAFEMDGNNKAIETNSNSTYKTDLIDRPVTLQLKFTGKDAYRQTIVADNGEQMIEEYERLK